MIISNCSPFLLPLFSFISTVRPRSKTSFSNKKASVFVIENPQTCKPVKFVDFCAGLPQSGTELSVNGTKSGKIGHRQSIPLRLSLSPTAALFIAPPHGTQLCRGLLEIVRSGHFDKNCCKYLQLTNSRRRRPNLILFPGKFWIKPDIVEDGQRAKYGRVGIPVEWCYNFRKKLEKS